MDDTKKWEAMKDEAVRIADTLFHGFYEKTIHPKHFDQWISHENFSWVGACEGEVYTSFKEAIEAYSHQRDMKEVPIMRVGKISYLEQPVSPHVFLLVCLVPLRLSLEETLLQENQRCTMVFKETDEGLRIVHIHTSNPWSLMPDKKVFPIAVARANYELFHTRLAEAKLTAYPDLSDRQKVILELLTQGKTYNAIAEILSITPRTVRYHVSELLAKFQVATKSELLARVKNE